MIRMNLWLFGGSGSSSGAGGSGGAGKGTGATPTGTGPGHHGSAGGQNMHSGNSAQDLPNRSTQVSSPVKSIDRKETYVIYDSKGKEVKEESGASLTSRIDNRTLRYNNMLEKWVDKRDNKQYVIRKKRR